MSAFDLNSSIHFTTIYYQRIIPPFEEISILLLVLRETLL